MKQIYLFNLCFAAFDLLPSDQDMFTVPLWVCIVCFFVVKSFEIKHCLPNYSLRLSMLSYVMNVGVIFFRVFKDKCINVDTIFLQFHDSSRVNWDSMGILCLFCSEKLFRLKKTYWIHKIGNVSWKWLCEVIMTSLNLMLPSFSITLC